jgi:hypothetical protein
MNTDPQQQRCAPLLWAGYAQRWAALKRRRWSIQECN